MGGGVMQLSLYGSQDVVLSGNPEITFFRLQYRRPSIFSMEAIQQSFQGTSDFGRRCVLPITKSGDLVHTTWLQVTLPDLSEYAIDAPEYATSTTPGILSARWTSSTAARVKIIPPTDGLSVSYVVTISDGTTSTTVNGAAGETTISLTGLNANVNAYTVQVKRKKADTTVGPNSAAVPIVTVRWCNSVGHALIRAVELEIGGSRIIRHVSEYLDILSELTLPEEKRPGFNTMIGKYDAYDVYDNSFDGERTLFIPMQFPHCRTPGLSIPQVALQYHQVNLNFDFRDYIELVKSDVPISALMNQRGQTPSATIDAYATFIFLGTEERRRFSTAPMEYLVDEIQYLGDIPIIVDTTEPNLTRKLNLNFSHPVSELIWVYNNASTYNSGVTPSQWPVVGNDYFNTNLPSTNADRDPVSSAVIHLNGHPRFSERPGAYFRLCQPYAHHTRIPAADKKIYVYSFGLSPEEASPSGSCNFSRLDTSHLVVRLDASMTNGISNGRMRVFAKSHNILRIAAGLAGLAFASG